MRKWCRPWWRGHLWNQYEMSSHLLDRNTLEHRVALLLVRVCDRCGKVD
jgi:hypothetical protein